MSEKLGACARSGTAREFHRPRCYRSSRPTGSSSSSRSDGPRRRALRRARKFQRTVSVVRRQDKEQTRGERSSTSSSTRRSSRPVRGAVAAVRTPRGLGVPYARASARDVSRRSAPPRLARGGPRRRGAHDAGRLALRGRPLAHPQGEELQGRGRASSSTDPGSKYVGRVGALICELPNGTRFNVGTGLSQGDARSRRHQLHHHVRYQELTNDGGPAVSVLRGRARRREVEPNHGGVALTPPTKTRPRARGAACGGSGPGPC